MKRFLQVFLLAGSIVPLAFGGSLNLSTGLDAANTLITVGGTSDAHWIFYNTSAPAQVVVPGSADWYTGWVGNGPNSNWIARDANTSAQGLAPLIFSVNFYLTDTTGASLTGQWAIDDAGTINLNGNVIGTLGSLDWGALTPVTTSTGFVAGLNTLTITITDNDNYLDAVRFEGLVTGNTVPEPGSWVLLLGGAAALASWRLRKR